MRVEVVDREEIEEKTMMTPGDVVMMLNETGGLRVQATSPSLGAASVRIQGMHGRYTRFLSDGLPLFGEQVGSIGLLQIPPSDLGQVEVIKGVASSLYGAGAMGGVVNLVSKRPGAAPEREILGNRSSRGATDGVLWYSAPLSPAWGATLVAGAHGQARADVNGDGWADLPKYARGVVLERDSHTTAYGEMTLRGAAPRQTWVVGAAIDRDAYDPEDLPAYAYAYTVPGVFGQDEIDVAKWLSVSASGRVDAHSRYGTFVSPRISVLVKGDDWSSRISAGSGFFAPTPLLEETEAAGLSRLTIPRPLKAERGGSASIDFSADTRGVKTTVTLFASRIRDPLHVTRDEV